MAAGLPMLYALERGNLLVPTFTAFVLGTGPLIRSRWGRIVALALSVNFKPYLLGVFLPAVARRDWRWLLGFGAIGLAIYTVTFIAQGAGTPQQLLFNIDIIGLAMSTLGATSSTTQPRTCRSRGSCRRTKASRPRSSPGAAPAFTFVNIVVMRLVQLAVAVCMVAGAIRPGGAGARGGSWRCSRR